MISKTDRVVRDVPRIFLFQHRAGQDGQAKLRQLHLQLWLIRRKQHRLGVQRQQLHVGVGRHRAVQKIAAAHGEGVYPPPPQGCVKLRMFFR